MNEDPAPGVRGGWVAKLSGLPLVLECSSQIFCRLQYCPVVRVVRRLAQAVDHPLGVDQSSVETFTLVGLAEADESVANIHRDQPVRKLRQEADQTLRQPGYAAFVAGDNAPESRCFVHFMTMCYTLHVYHNNIPFLKVLPSVAAR